MDDSLKERLVYSESEGSSNDEMNSVNRRRDEYEPNENSFSNSNQELDFNASEVKDESDNNITVRRKIKMFSKIITSDDEKDNVNSGRQANKVENRKIVSTVIRENSIWGTDSGSSNENKKDHNKKKQRKKKIINRKLQEESNGSDSDDNSNIYKNKSNQNVSSKMISLCDYKSSDSSIYENSPSSPKNERTHNVHRKKTQQRMTAKVAEEQIKEIQSESQRMARDIYINVPYHKPKQHSLKEFLSRRSIAKQQQQANYNPVQKAAAAIKMSKEELILYAEGLEQRAQEAMDFFQNEFEEKELKSENIEPNKDIVSASGIQSTNAEILHNSVPIELNEINVFEFEHSSDGNLESIEAVENQNGNKFLEQNEDNASHTIEKPLEINESNKKTMTENDTEVDASTDNQIHLHTTKTQLDYEIDKLQEENKKSNVRHSFCPNMKNTPTLRGNNNMVIDFETNELKRKEKSGVDELFERFLKHSSKNTNAKNESTDLSLFDIITGHFEKVTHTSVANKMNTDTKPGQAYFKLKSELNKKINEKRRDLLTKRMEEEKQKQKEMESDDDEEMEEYSDCEASDSETENIKAKKSFSDNDHGESVNNEIEEPDNGDALTYEEDGNVDDGSYSERNIKPKRSRIVEIVEDDSDDETAPYITNAQKQKSGSIEPSNTLNISNEISTQTFADNNSHLRKDLTETSNKNEEKLDTVDSMQEFESRLLQIDTPDKTTHTESQLNSIRSNTLFSQNNDDIEVVESQLMALCSGEFITQHPFQNTHSAVYSKNDEEPKTGARELLLFSDDEENENKEINRNTNKSKRMKNKKLDYSDDEDDENEINLAVEENSVHNEEDILTGDCGEQYIEYDSDENEVEVTMKRNDVCKKAFEYFENEAELSESEWGSADEDEKDLDNFEGELGDEDEFDRIKIQSELERIRMRQQIDEDAREVRILKEMFIEEEDNGEQRERKFKWTHLENVGSDMSTMITGNQMGEGITQNESEDENEEEWRRLRYKREQLLKQQLLASESTTVVDTTEIRAPKSSEDIRRTSIVKLSSNVTLKSSSPFLINKVDLSAVHIGRKSFLSRDSKTLEKLATLTKAGDDTITNTSSGKGSYVFTATENKNVLKRRSDTEEIVENNINKKMKLCNKQRSSGVFELLN